MLIPQYMEMIGVVPEMEYDDGNGSQAARQTGPQVDTYSATPSVPEKNHLHSAGVSEILTIITPLYKANISSYGGGSVVYYKIHETKNQTQRYVGGYDSLGVYSKANNVVLLHDIGHTPDYCAPCLSVKDEGVFKKHNQAFSRKTSIDIILSLIHI